MNVDRAVSQAFVEVFGFCPLTQPPASFDLVKLRRAKFNSCRHLLEDFAGLVNVSVDRIKNRGGGKEATELRRKFIRHADRHGHSQAAIAEAVGLSQGYVSQVLIADAASRGPDQ